MFTKMDTSYSSSCHILSSLNFTQQNANITMYESFPLITLAAAYPALDTLIILPRNVTTLNACLDNVVPEKYPMEHLYCIHSS